MELDIREKTVNTIETIRFGDDTNDVLTYIPGDQHIEDHMMFCSDQRIILPEEIDDLILALKKAKEIWFT